MPKKSNQSQSRTHVPLIMAHSVTPTSSYSTSSTPTPTISGAHRCITAHPYTQTSTIYLAALWGGGSV